MTRTAGTTRSLMTIGLLILFSFAGVGAGAGPAGAGEKGVRTEYVCPPCGDAHDDKVYEKPGSCLICGMTLIKKREAGSIKNVGILVFDGVQIIDYTGPYEVFGQAGMKVFTVSEKGETITTNMGMSVNPTHSFATSPAADILLIPGGSVNASYENPKVIEWIRKQSAGAENVLSVCNGAFILAKTGLIDGMSATTYYGLIDALKTFAPRVKVVSDQRYVDNGKFITSAGLSSGIDASLYLVSRVSGMEKAEAVALNMEYDWRPDSGYARGAFADMKMPNLEFPDGVTMWTVKASGDRDRWEAHHSVKGPLPADEVLQHVNRELAKLENWKLAATKKTGRMERTTWNFKDDEGDRWICETFVGPSTQESGGPTFAYTLRRAGEATARSTKKVSR